MNLNIEIDSLRVMLFQIDIKHQKLQNYAKNGLRVMLFQIDIKHVFSLLYNEDSLRVMLFQIDIKLDPITGEPILCLRVMSLKNGVNEFYQHHYFFN